jgi:hypothetical protein
MENNNLLQMWKEGNQEILRDKRFERSELETFLKPKISKATFSLNYNIVAYMAAQLAAMVLIGLDLYGYRSNPVMLKALIPMFIACSSFFGYGVFLLSHIWQINHSDFDLVTAINKKIKVYRRHYEAWMWIGAVSTLFLIFALNTWVDNDQGTYRINRPVFFAVVSFSVLIFIYGIQKIAQLKVVREIKIYLSDIQNEVMEGSHQIEQAKRKYMVVCVILAIIFTIFFILGIIKAISY